MLGSLGHRIDPAEVEASPEEHRLVSAQELENPK
jgi:hypothetical protein